MLAYVAQNNAIKPESAIYLDLIKKLYSIRIVNT